MTDILSEERIAEIEQRAKAATPGPWSTAMEYSVSGPDFIWGVMPHASMGKKRVVCGDMDGEDARFIAHSRTDIPDLLTSHRALATKLKEATDEIKLRTDENDLMRSTFRDAVSRAELADTYERWLLDIGK